MEQLKALKEQLVSVIQGQMGDLKNTDAKELGEVVDMVKDLADAMKLCEEEKYYKTITDAMKEKKENLRYYTMPCPIYHDEPPMYYTEERDMDRYMGRLYYRGQPRDSQGRFKGYESNYDANGSRGGMDSSNSYSTNESSRSGIGERIYHEHEFALGMRDSREGRSPASRRTYMESKEMHKDKQVKIKDLENYMKELSDDIVDMIADTSPEEKQLLEKKITALANKVA